MCDTSHGIAVSKEGSRTREQSGHKTRLREQGNIHSALRQEQSWGGSRGAELGIHRVGAGNDPGVQSWGSMGSELGMIQGCRAGDDPWGSNLGMIQGTKSGNPQDQSWESMESELGMIHENKAGNDPMDQSWE